MKFKQNAFLWLLVGCGVLMLALALDADRKSDGFFVAVRVAVCFASAYTAVMAYRQKREIWTWLLGANAALYNPFALVRLTQDLWSLVDVADIGLLVAAGIVLRVRAEQPARTNDLGSTSHIATGVPHEKLYRTPSRVEIAIWVTLLFLVLAGAFMSQYAGYLDGATQSQARGRELGSATLGLAFWAYVIARVRHWRWPGRIALAAFSAGLVTAFSGSAVGGYIRGKETNESLVSIGRFAPALEARLRGGKDSTDVSLSVLVNATLARAVQQAPDKSLVAYEQERFALIQSDSATAFKRCVMAFNGDSEFHLTAREEHRFLRIIGDLYSAAAAERRPTGSDAERSAAESSAVALFKKIDPTGVLDDETRRKALPDPERCRMYTQMMTELQSMPVEQAAATIRAMTVE